MKSVSKEKPSGGHEGYCRHQCRDIVEGLNAARDLDRGKFTQAHVKAELLDTLKTLDRMLKGGTPINPEALPHGVIKEAIAKAEAVIGQ